jgi:magnesium chelatase family protein
MDPKPGELSLSHYGVLFLDELPEFRRDALEALREPLEDGVVSVARAAGSRTFPARFLLVGAMNPCPCGFRGDPRHTCRCSDRDIGRYRRKISGPLLDRIDLHVDVPALAAADFGTVGEGERSSSVRSRVVSARGRQYRRTADPRLTNGGLSGRALKRDGRLSEPARKLLERAVDRLGLSARAYHRVIRVALSIADLEGADGIGDSHVAEALRYRPGSGTPVP